MAPPPHKASFIDLYNATPHKGKGIDHGDDVELSMDEMETALAISEDEPTLREALKGDKKEAWMDAIDTELT